MKRRRHSDTPTIDRASAAELAAIARRTISGFGAVDIDTLRKGIARQKAARLAAAPDPQPSRKRPAPQPRECAKFRILP
jgi:hypothetical protein